MVHTGLLQVGKQQILHQAKDHLNEKHTYFGHKALKIVTLFFSSEKYTEQPKEIALYAAWAIRSDGPSV